MTKSKNTVCLSVLFIYTLTALLEDKVVAQLFTKLSESIHKCSPEEAVQHDCSHSTDFSNFWPQIYELRHAPPPTHTRNPFYFIIFSCMPYAQFSKYITTKNWDPWFIHGEVGNNTHSTKHFNFCSVHFSLCPSSSCSIQLDVKLWHTKHMYVNCLPLQEACVYNLQTTSDGLQYCREMDSFILLNRSGKWT